MSSPSRNDASKGRKKKIKNGTANADREDSSSATMMTLQPVRGVASALDDRPEMSPRVARTPGGGAPSDWRARLGSSGTRGRGGYEDDGAVEMKSLLSEDQKRAAVSGADDSVEELGGARSKRPLSLNS